MEIITKIEAKERGLKRFFTGVPCKHGHISERKTSSGACIKCINTMNIAWKAKSGYDKRFRDKEGKKEQRTEIHKIWRHSNPDKAVKYRNSVQGKNKHREWNSSTGKINRLLANLRTRAKQRDLSFDLTVDDLVIPATCPILNIPLYFGVSNDNTPSVDRIDNTRGYTKDNIQVISKRANRLKSDATLTELKSIVQYMEQHQENTNES